MRHAVILLLAVGASLASGRPAVAQGRVPLGRRVVTAADSIAVSTLRPGDRLLVDMGAAGRFEGRYVSGSGALFDFALEPGGELREVDLSDVARIWARGPSTERGIWIGAMSGFATGVVLGIGLAEVDCDPYDGDNCRTWQVAGAYGGLGALGGAVVGGVVGRLIDSWRLLIPG